MRLLRWLFGLLTLVAVLWFAATVRLGKKTLLGHLWAIAHTREARDLAAGTRQEAGKLAERVKRDLVSDGGSGPLEDITDDDRKEVDRLVKERSHK